MNRLTMKEVVGDGMAQSHSRDMFENLELGALVVGVVLLVVYLQTGSETILIPALVILAAAVGIDEAHNWI